MSESNLATESNELNYQKWATALREGTLLGQRCSDCEHATAAPKAACARCGSQNLEAIELPSTGEVYTETRLEVVPEGFEGSHHVVLVALGDVKVMAHVPEAVEIGDRVELTSTIEDNGAVAPVFEPN